jgi:hypothetical protein
MVWVLVVTTSMGRSMAGDDMDDDDVITYLIGKRNCKNKAELCDAHNPCCSRLMCKPGFGGSKCWAKPKKPELKHYVNQEPLRTSSIELSASEVENERIKAMIFGKVKH